MQIHIMVIYLEFRRKMLIQKTKNRFSRLKLIKRKLTRLQLIKNSETRIHTPNLIVMNARCHCQYQKLNLESFLKSYLERSLKLVGRFLIKDGIIVSSKDGIMEIVGVKVGIIHEIAIGIE